ncbi:hypothetical protein CCP3SC15_1920004 [Gammaproteobacteria bacterium]
MNKFIELYNEYRDKRVKGEINIKFDLWLVERIVAVTSERDRAGELIAFFNGRLSEEIMNSERLAEELRLEQNPGCSCEALRMHDALRLSRKQNTEAPHD